MLSQVRLCLREHTYTQSTSFTPNETAGRVPSRRQMSLERVENKEGVRRDKRSNEGGDT